MRKERRRRPPTIGKRVLQRIWMASMARWHGRTDSGRSEDTDRDRPPHALVVVLLLRRRRGRRAAGRVGRALRQEIFAAAVVVECVAIGRRWEGAREAALAKVAVGSDLTRTVACAKLGRGRPGGHHQQQQAGGRGGWRRAGNHQPSVWLPHRH